MSTFRELKTFKIISTKYEVRFYINRQQSVTDLIRSLQRVPTNAVLCVEDTEIDEDMDEVTLVFESKSAIETENPNAPQTP